MSAPESATERNLRRLQEAADRLLGGRPDSLKQVSEGLTLSDLAKESGVPRPYFYRDAYRTVALDFLERQRRQREAGELPDAQVAKIQQLKKKLAKEEARAKRGRAAMRELKEDQKSAASQIIYLAEQNKLLRRELEQARQVTQLRRTEP